MINLTAAPRTGRVLAYAPSRLVYDGYELKGDDIALCDGSVLDLADVYELHLFDAATELRAIREDGDWVIIVAQVQDELEDEDHFTFSESQFVKERFWVDTPDERIVVNNRFSFDDEGFLRLDGYRLAMEAV